jgi:uncharacterized membrane protein YfcA
VSATLHTLHTLYTLVGATTFDATTGYVLLVVFVATLIRSALGFGEALVAVPLLALRLPITVAAPLAVLVSVVVAGVIVVQDWRRVDVRSAGRLVVASLCGIPLGVGLLTLGDERVVKTLLGLVIVGFALSALRGRMRWRLEAEHRLPLLGAGFVAGVLGGAYGMNGPPLAMYGAARGWSPQQFRATLQGYFLPASLAGLLGYLTAGLWDHAVTRYFLLSLPGIVVAVAAGRALNHRLRGDAFFRCVYAGLVVVGAVLVGQAVAR